MSERYHRLEGRVLLEGKGVLHWMQGDREAIEFRCPCGARRVYVTSPPHKIEFGDGDTLKSLGGSCGYRARNNRPANWCHFTITDGVAEMHSDAKCPGGTGELP